MSQQTLKILKGQVFILILIVFIGLGLAPRQALSTPSADFLYSEMNLGGGLWRYNYTLFNTSNPTSEAGFDLFDAFLTFDPAVTFTLLSLPAGWSETDGPGFVDTFSLNPGPPPTGADIPPGTSLAGFGFQFDSRVGNIPFEATFTNPNDPSNPFVFDNTTAPASTAVPEPGTLILFGMGLIGMRQLRANNGRRT